MKWNFQNHKVNYSTFDGEASTNYSVINKIWCLWLLTNNMFICFNPACSSPLKVPHSWSKWIKWEQNIRNTLALHTLPLDHHASGRITQEVKNIRNTLALHTLPLDHHASGRITQEVKNIRNTLVLHTLPLDHHASGRITQEVNWTFSLSNHGRIKRVFFVCLFLFLGFFCKQQ